MALHPFAGKPARLEDLTNIPRLISEYYLNKPDMSVIEQRVTFGTSGHRGSSLTSAFTESHILAISPRSVRACILHRSGSSCCQRRKGMR